jgi:kelch-like protein 18
MSKDMNTVYAYRWSMVAPMNVMRSRVALVSNMGKLWAIGGYDGVCNLSTVEVYDPSTDSWSFVPSMCAHEGGVGVGVIPMFKLTLQETVNIVRGHLSILPEVIYI